MSNGMERGSRVLLLVAAGACLCTPGNAQQVESGPRRFLGVKEWDISIQLERSGKGQATIGSMVASRTNEQRLDARAQLAAGKAIAGGVLQFEGVPEVMVEVADTCTMNPDVRTQSTYVIKGGGRSTQATIEFNVEASLDTYSFKIDFGRFSPKFIQAHDTGSGHFENTSTLDESAAGVAAQASLPLPDTGWVLEGSAYLEEIELPTSRCPTIRLDAPLMVTWRMAPAALQKDDYFAQLDSCAYLVPQATSELKTRVRPTGGTFSWSTTPSGIVDVEGPGENPLLVGRAPGEARVEMTYVAPDGKRLTDSIEADVIVVHSINNGGPMPEVELFDFEGNAASATVVPINWQPGKEGTLRFELDGDGRARVAAQGPRLEIFGEQPGRVAAQGESYCGNHTGPAVEFEVVRCSEATRRRVQEFNDRLAADESRLLSDMEDVRAEANSLAAEPEVFGKESLRTTLDAFTQIIAAAGGRASGVAAAATELQATYLQDALRRAIDLGASQGRTEQLEAALALAHEMLPADADGRVIEMLDEWMQEFQRAAANLDRAWNLFDRMTKYREQLELSIAEHKLFCEEDADLQAEAADETDAPEPPVSPPPPVTEPQPAQLGGFPLEDCGCATYDRSAWDQSSSGLRAISSDLQRSVACGRNLSGEFGVAGTALATLDAIPARIAAAESLPDAGRSAALMAIAADLEASSATLEGFSHDVTVVTGSLSSCETTFTEVARLMRESAQHVDATFSETRQAVESVRR